MLSIESTLFYFSLLLIAATLIRSYFNFKYLLSNLKWIIRKYNYVKLNPKSTAEKFIICIPMLREQGIVSDTLRYFSTLDYPKDKYKIIAVTTEKELFEKMQKVKLLKKLAKDVSQGKSLKTVLDRYLGLFPLNELERIHKKYRDNTYPSVLKSVKSLYKQLPTTYDLASKEAEIINTRLKIKFITVINYPRIKGGMSYQINYAARECMKSKQNTDAIYAVYNADSRPNLNTLHYVAFTLLEFEKQTGIKPNIVQQSSLFTLNYNKYPKTITGYSLKAAALLQTKWTLVHELTRFRSQSRKVIKKGGNYISIILNTKISHCVGHGLFVRLRVLNNEYLPTETITDDLPFGYYQCCKGEPILPLPILENSENPYTLKSLINQKRIWFSPYFQYMSCRERVLRFKKYRSRLEVEILTYQAMVTGFIWFIQSLVLFIPLITSIYYGNIFLFIVWILGIIYYWFLPVGIIYNNLKKLEIMAGKSISETSKLDYIYMSFSGIFILCIHSLGPILSMSDFALKQMINKPIFYQKTER